ncbi:Protein of unknown function [Gryllus bimaculatus]|nr:Protein of unknown function [Gryllus bimaculatus]
MQAAAPLPVGPQPVAWPAALGLEVRPGRQAQRDRVRQTTLAETALLHHHRGAPRASPPQAHHPPPPSCGGGGSGSGSASSAHQALAQHTPPQGSPQPAPAQHKHRSPHHRHQEGSTHIDGNSNFAFLDSPHDAMTLVRFGLSKGLQEVSYTESVALLVRL